jgi:23S rRNA (uracil1939-C5)-methyltransferase
VTERRPTAGPGGEVELTLTELAAGGDAVGRDAAGRVTFVPRGCPGDRVRVGLTRATTSFARGELRALLAPGPARVPPPCPWFAEDGGGCGGCAWLHVARPAQLAAKQAVVAGALRGLVAHGLALAPIQDPAPALGWRRRARFHAVAGRLGLYAHGSHRVVAIASCAQLAPALEAARAAVAATHPPDGEVHLLLGHRGEIVVAHDGQGAWPGAAALVGQAGIIGVAVAERRYGEAALELEPGLWCDATAFAQASAAGNAALIATVGAALGPGPGELVELHAGGGNLTRGLLADGWRVHASDVVAPRHPIVGAGLVREVGAAASVLAGLVARGVIVDAVVLDPPRTGAAEVVGALAALAPPRIVYVSCDVATLARDAARLVALGYRAEQAWPIDLMPQTAHVEVVLTLRRGEAA